MQATTTRNMSIDLLFGAPGLFFPYPLIDARICSNVARVVHMYPSSGPKWIRPKRKPIRALNCKKSRTRRRCRLFMKREENPPSFPSPDLPYIYFSSYIYPSICSSGFRLPIIFTLREYPPPIFLFLFTCAAFPVLLVASRCRFHAFVTRERSHEHRVDPIPADPMENGDPRRNGTTRGLRNVFRASRDASYPS